MALFNFLITKFTLLPSAYPAKKAESETVSELVLRIVAFFWILSREKSKEFLYLRVQGESKSNFTALNNFYNNFKRKLLNYQCKVLQNILILFARCRWHTKTSIIFFYTKIHKLYEMIVIENYPIYIYISHLNNIYYIRIIFTIQILFTIHYL